MKQRIDQTRHYFATSVGEWKVDEDLESLIKRMKKSGMAFSVWLVPLNKEAPYEIRQYLPQVEGVIHIGSWGE